MIYTNGREYTNTVGPAGTTMSYTHLEKYNPPTNALGNNGNTGSPFVGPNNSQGPYYIVPNFSAVTYDALTHGLTPTVGYFNITSAYGAGAGSCNTQYKLRMIDQ